jgi:hypothetical protein
MLDQVCEPAIFPSRTLSSRSKTVNAKHYAMYELDAMSKSYAQAWKKFWN